MERMDDYSLRSKNYQEKWFIDHILTKMEVTKGIWNRALLLLKIFKDLAQKC